MAPFVTAHTFCASRDIQVSEGICPLIQHFCTVYDCGKNRSWQGLSNSMGRKLGVATHFSEIIELKFGTKINCHTFFVF